MVSTYTQVITLMERLLNDDDANDDNALRKIMRENNGLRIIS